MKDASASTGSKDLLEGIPRLMRGAGVTIAIFSHETRTTALANIALELGFAAMCGKPLIIVRSKEAVAPSDLIRTDWIEYDPEERKVFEGRLRLAFEQADEFADHEAMPPDVALEASTPDCAVAFERANKAFLLNGNSELLDKADLIRARLVEARDNLHLTDLARLHDEVATSVRQGRKRLAAQGR